MVIGAALPLEAAPHASRSLL